MAGPLPKSHRHLPEGRGEQEEGFPASAALSLSRSLPILLQRQDR